MQPFILAFLPLSFFLQVATALTCLWAVASHLERLPWFFSFLHFFSSFCSSVSGFLTTFDPHTALVPVVTDLTSFAFVGTLMKAPFCPIISVGRFSAVVQSSPKPLKAECGPRGS